MNTENKESLNRRDQEVKKKDTEKAEAHGKRVKLADEIIELVKNEGEE